MFTMMPMALLTLLLSTLATPDDWPQFAGPTGENKSPETGLVREFPDEKAEVLWTLEVRDGYSGVAIRDGEVFLLDRELGEKDILRVFDLESGEELWQFEHAVEGRLMFPGARSVPTVEEEFIYVQSGFGPVYCIDRTKERLEWMVDVTKEYEGAMPMFGYSNSPLVWEDTVILAPLGPKVGLIGLDRFTGELRWKTEGFGSSHSTPHLVNLLGRPQILMMGAQIDPSVFAQASDAQEEPPTEPPPGIMKAEPVDSIVPEEMADMTMPGTGLLCSFSPEGELLWKTDTYYCSTPIPTPVRVDDHHVFLSGGYKAGSVLLKLAESDGGVTVTEVFRHSKGTQTHIPLFHDDHLYLIVNENANDPRRRRSQGGLMCLDLEGNEMWRTGNSPYLGRGAMILADDMLIVQNGRNGSLNLVEPTPKEFRLLAKANVFGIDDRKDHQMWAPLALSDGRLLMRSQGELKCIDLRAN